MKKTLKAIAAATATMILFACGGGSSSSGGSPAEPAAPSIAGKYEGTYDLGIYKGTIAITINSIESVLVRFTGISCLQSTVSEGLTAELSNGRATVGGDIVGQPDGNLGIPAFLRADFPAGGGDGTIDLDPGAPCLSRVGTLSVTKLN